MSEDKRKNASENLKVTSSFGVAEFNGESEEQFIRNADNALYEAKRNGRNRVEINRNPHH